jgi:hypothetical protein
MNNQAQSHQAVTHVEDSRVREQLRDELIQDKVTLPISQTASSQLQSAWKMSQVVHANKKKARLKVAFAVFVSDVSSKEWEDALRVLAYGIKKAANKSKHEVRLVALSPKRLDTDKESVLKSYGFEDVLRRPVPVPASVMPHGEARQHMERRQGSDSRFQFLMEEETIKYWGVAMTDYDRVLVLDADFMILDPMDELMEADADFIGIYDHGLDTPDSHVPPAQGGFLLFRPSLADFEEIKGLTREADWKADGTGWKGSRIGYCYGGVGPDGLLAYYYNKDALRNLPKKVLLSEGLSNPPERDSRMHAVERPVYDLVINERLMRELENASKEETIAGVKSVHFTGNCIKPWTCSEAKDWLCEGMFKKWWALRAEAEKAAGLPPTPMACDKEHYEPMIRL